VSKQKSVFVCQQCGAEFPKWLGQCAQCGAWNSLVETNLAPSSSRQPAWLTSASAPQPMRLDAIKSTHRDRFKTGFSELDRVLGGGIVPGSVILLAGQPGVGKSTLMLQLVEKISQAKSQKTARPSSVPPARPARRNSVLYISGEESARQIKLRAERLGIKAGKIWLLAETNVDLILKQLNNAFLVVIDSVQTLYTDQLTGAAGSVGQVRECAARLLKFAKLNGVSVFLIGHITKQGAIAGPKVLEHLVDTVVYFEGDKFGGVRLLRASKNRFGPTDEVGIFAMTDQGLAEVANPSKLFLQSQDQSVPGSVVVATMEGTRPVLVEVQALVAPTRLAMPRRIAQGIDYRRLQLVSAVLSKRLGLPLAGFDIFIKVAGGFKIEEPAVDLGVALAILTSYKDLLLPAKTVCFGEIDLLGAIRPVSQAAQRKKEARRLGFTKIISADNYHFLSQVAKTLFKNKQA